jgi:magnesium transporter
MILRNCQNNITWLDVVSPTQNEIHELIDECGIPREYASDLTTMTPKTEVFSRKNFLKITLDFPIVKRTDINHPHEVKFIVTKTHFITIRFEDFEAIHRFGKEYEVLCLSKGKQKALPETLFITLLTHLYEAMYVKLDYLESRLKDIEEEIFNQHEEAMVFELSNVSRRLITFKQTIDAHDEALLKLESAVKTAFTKDHQTSIEAIIHQYRIIEHRLVALTSTFNDLRQTNDSLLETKQNSIMKILTIISFITFPLMLFSSMFGMNTEHTPIIGRPIDFWIIVMIMIAVSLVLLIFFKYKRWI